MLTRRRFLQSAAALYAGSFLLGGRIPAALAAHDALEVKELGKGQWLLSGGGGNVLLLQNGGHPLLVDACVAAVAGELVQDVTGRIGTSALTLVNTHHHADHIGGNFALRRRFGDQLRVVAHEKVAPRVADTLEQSIRPGLQQAAAEAPELAELAAGLKADEFLPATTFATTLKLDTGGTPCTLHHYGPGHTDNDAVVHFPELDVLHVGDLVFNNLYPYVLPQHGATISGWQNSLRRLRLLCTASTRVIPGHGDMGGPELIDHMLEFFAQAQEIVAAAISQGLAREQVAELKPEIFAGRGFQGVSHLTMTRIFDEMTGGQ